MDIQYLWANLAGPFSQSNITLDKPVGTKLVKIYAVNNNLANFL